MSSVTTSNRGSSANRTEQTERTESPQRSALRLFTDLSITNEATVSNGTKSPSSPVSPASELLRRIGILDEHRSFHMRQNEGEEALQRRRSRRTASSRNDTSTDDWSNAQSNPLTPMWVLKARENGESHKSALDIYRAQEANEGAKGSKLEVTVEAETEE